MKIAVSTYSFGEYIKSRKLGIFGVMDKAQEMGFEGLEIAEDDYTGDLSLMEMVGEFSRKMELPIVSYDVSADFTRKECTAVDEEVERVKRLVDTAAALGAPMIRHDVSYGNFGGKSGLGFDEVLPYIIDGCRRITEYAETLGIKTMVENHGHFIGTSRRLEKIYHGVAHPNFMILCDIGNFMCADENPCCGVGNVAPFTGHVHVKDFHCKSGILGCPGEGWFPTKGGNYLRGAIIGHGDASVTQSLDILKRNGYDGYVTLEFEGIEDNLMGIKLGLDNLKRYLK